MPDQRQELPQVQSDAASAHARSIAEMELALGVETDRGLSPAEAAQRLGSFGRNELAATRPTSVWAMLWEALTEPFVVLLVVAGVLAVAVGEVRDGLLVLFGLLPIVGADVVIGYRGERALDALRESAAPVARVRREAGILEIPAAELVPGDMALLAVGDVVPADIRLSRVDALLLDRSVLTGESVPEPGSVEPDAADAAIVDRHAVAFSGTRVIQGRAEGIVFATGSASQLGRIASGLGRETRRRSPLQHELDRLVRILLVVAIALIVITGGLALWRGESIGVALLAGVAAAIAAIPEEPPVLLAVVLGLGAYRLLRRGVLVRRLNAQETLSAVDLILTDKTGTLTQNRLELEAVFTPTSTLDGESRREVEVLAFRAQDDAWYRARGARVGSFTRALERRLAETGGVPELAAADLIDAQPASGSHPYTKTIAQREAGLEELVLGAPEVVLTLVGYEEVAAAWQRLAEGHADAGRRLLMLARADERGATHNQGEPAFQPLGLLAFSDPLRPDVGEALQQATGAGIQTIVVTGDHPLTTARIAAAAGLPEGTAITGDELATWDDARLARELPALRIVARALPEQKLRIVEAAQRAGRTVAVTGDGVNDAPALEHADVAVAMGSGSAVAREASDLVLGDDSFATLMNGLREGRRLVANIQKGLVFLVSTHVALLGFVLVATLYGFSQPLLPIHILWLEFFIDISTSVAFEREPEEPGMMRARPRLRTTPLLSRGLLLRVALAGSWTVLGALVIIATHSGGLDHARWVAFNALVLGQVVRAYANRSLTLPVFALRRNSVLLAACLISLVAQLAIPYVPVLADAFRAAPLDLEDWALVVTVALVPAVFAQIVRHTTHRAWVA